MPPSLMLTQIGLRAATLGGLGYLPWAPGTWGSLVGAAIGVGAVHLLPPAIWLVLLAGGYVGAVALCAEAEAALGAHDPGPVVLDEAWAMAAVVGGAPWCADSPAWLAAACALFRVFDIRKPPPLKRFERWPGGWGVMGDDLGAALWTLALLWLARRLLGG